jgi:single-strand DNA-binding protein
MLNRVLITGNLTQDPEVRYIPSGAAVANLRLASNRRYKDVTSGEWKDDTCYVNVVAWRQLAERCGDSLHKGSPVLVEGRLQSRSWEADDGQRRSTIEIVADRIQFLERTRSGEEAPAYAGAGSGPAEPGGEPGGSPGEGLPADDLPF